MVVVGGGSVAAGRVSALAEARARVRVVSPTFAADLEQRTDVEREARPYAPEVLAGAELVFVCTDDRALNARIAADARIAGIWCNVADEPEHCDFYVPAMFHRGPLTVAVGTGGASPGLAGRVRDELASHVGAEFGILTEELGRVRATVLDRVADPAVRRRVFETLSSDESLGRLTRDGRSAWRVWSEQVLARAIDDRRDEPDNE